MSTVRLVTRLLAVSLVTLFLLAVWALGLLPAAALGRRATWRTAIVGTWARALVRILGMSVVEDGDRPTGAFLLVSNHLSYVDILLLASRIRGVFVAKSEVREWPILGPLAVLGGTLFVQRRRNRDLHRVAERIRATLGEGFGVILFPEGTSTAGAEVAAFRSSLLEPAAALELPVHTVAIRYETPAGAPPAHLAVSWWGDMTFLPHLLGLLRLPGFEAHVAFGEEPVRDSDRKALAAKLHDAVSAGFVPMLEQEQACLTNGN